MKVKDLAIDQEVIINSFPYKYKGEQKVKTPTSGAEQKLVFERDTGNNYDYKYFDLKVGNKELKEANRKLELK